jgi:iron complex outermembrane receptor protein
LFGDLSWKFLPDTEAGMEFRATSGTPVNDANTDAAAGAGVWAARLGRSWVLPQGRLQLLARVDNLSDRRYAASVIVNEGNGRYFEPAAGRTWWLGAKWRTDF